MFQPHEASEKRVQEGVSIEAGREPGRATPWNGWSSLHQWASSWGIAVALVVVAYPGVVLFSGSLASSNIDPVAGTSAVGPPVPGVWPNFVAAAQQYQWGDTGASLWQYEPAYRKLADAPGSAWWDPTMAAGMPGREILSDGAASPVAFLTAALGGGPGAFTFASLLLAVIGTAAIVHVLRAELGTSSWAAAAGAGVFLLGGFGAGYLNSQVGQPYFFAAPALLAVVRALDSPRPFTLVAAVMALAAMILAGFPSTVLTCGAAVVLLAVMWRTIPVRRWAPTLGGVIIGAAAVTAVFWVPAVAHLMRGGLESYAGRGLPVRHPADVLALASPVHAWSMQDPATRPAGTTTTFTAYLGALGLGFALFSRKRDRLGWTAFAIVVVGALVHLQLGPIVWLLQVGGLSAIRPIYWAAPATIAAAIAVGRGVDSAGRRELLAVGGLTAALVVVCQVTRATHDLPITRATAVATGLHLALAIALLVSAARWRRPSSRVQATAALLVVVELVAFAPHLFSPRVDIAEHVPAALASLSSDPGDRVRIVNVGRRLVYPNWAGVLGFEQFDTLSTPQLPWTRQFFDANVTREDAAHHLFLLTLGNTDDDHLLNVNRSALDAAGVTHVVVANEYGQVRETFADMPVAAVDDDTRLTVLANTTAFPIAHLTGRPREHDFDTAPRPDFSQSKPLTDDPRLLELSNELPAAAPAGTVEVVRRDPQRMTLEVDASAAALLAVTDAWHPAWRARVDGVPAHVGRVNQMFRGVVVPPGRSVVEMRYEPVELVAGRWISIAAMLVVAAFLIEGVRRDQRARRRRATL